MLLRTSSVASRVASQREAYPSKSLPNRLRSRPRLIESNQRSLALSTACKSDLYRAREARTAPKYRTAQRAVPMMTLPKVTAASVRANLSDNPKMAQMVQRLTKREVVVHRVMVGTTVVASAPNS